MNTTLLKASMIFALWVPAAAWSQIALSITVAPPPLPEYDQPLVPGDGYLWTPGYWSWDPSANDYHWILGTWVLAPAVGQLWTPGYWGYQDSDYRWHSGYWGNTVGYYGGINYGYGYSGSGYQGGRWRQGAFQYNRAVNNVNVTVVHSVYNAPVAPAARGARTSFNGRAPGTPTQVTAAEGGKPSAGHGVPVLAPRRSAAPAGAGAEPAHAHSPERSPAVVTARPAASTEPAVVRVGPARTESGRTESVKTEPARREPIKVEPARKEPVRAEPVKGQPAKTQPEKAATVRPAQPAQHAEHASAREELPRGER